MVIIEMQDDIIEKSGSLLIPTQQFKEDLHRRKAKRESGGKGYNLHIRRGKVYDVGKEITNVKKGDDVVFNKYGGWEFDLDKKHLISLSPEGLLAKIVMSQ